MYTSGWNVNQNKCWYAMGSPPIAGLKKPDTPNLSVYIITMAAEKVGIKTIAINDVMSTAHTNNGIFIVGKSGCFILSIVITKLIEPSIEEIPNIFTTIAVLEELLSNQTLMCFKRSQYNKKTTGVRKRHIRSN